MQKNSMSVLLSFAIVFSACGAELDERLADTEDHLVYEEDPGGGGGGGGGGGSGGCTPVMSITGLSANRQRLIQDLASRRGQSTCALWSGMSSSAKGAFYTITHRLQGTFFRADCSPFLNHVDALYAALGQIGSGCGGAGNRLMISTDYAAWEKMVWAFDDLDVLIDGNRNMAVQHNRDLAGAHGPFNASNQSNYGWPRMQVHFWWDWSRGAFTSVCRPEMGCITDWHIMEIDQDYNWIHDSNTQCTYSGRTGRQMYESNYGFTDYGWRPAGC